MGSVACSQNAGLRAAVRYPVQQFYTVQQYPVQQSVPLFNKCQVVFDLLSIRGNRGNVKFDVRDFWP